MQNTENSVCSSCFFFLQITKCTTMGKLPASIQLHSHCHLCIVLVIADVVFLMLLCC